MSHIAAAALLLVGCAQPPMGPTVQVMPGLGKSFPDFQNGQAVCQAFANNAVQGQAQSANNQAVGTAAVGTVVGAGTSLVGGTAIGAQGSANTQLSIQQQYDNAFAQCTALVQAVQAQLIRLRYLGGTADGVQWPQTTSAIVNFERTNGMQVDGVASPELLARLQALP